MVFFKDIFYRNAFFQLCFSVLLLAVFISGCKYIEDAVNDPIVKPPPSATYHPGCVDDALNVNPWAIDKYLGGDFRGRELRNMGTLDGNQFGDIGGNDLFAVAGEADFFLNAKNVP